MFEFLKKNSSNQDFNVSYDIIFKHSNIHSNVLIFVENINATYYLSFHYVIQRLTNKSQINLWVLSSKTIASLLDGKARNPESLTQKIINDLHPTLAIFSRYSLPHGLLLQQYFQSKNIPTIYHIDDDLINLPRSLGKEIQKQHGNQKVIKERQALLANVDLIYASTQSLNHKLARIFPKQKIFSGIYAPYLESLIDKSNKSQNHSSQKNQKPFLKIGYMGSKGHYQDLKMVAPAIAKILSDYPNITFEIFGTISIPDQLKIFNNRITAHKVTVHYQQFLQYLYELSWDIGLAPLEDTEFNKCKAPTKFIEYTACHIPTIASNLNVYNCFCDGEEILLAHPNQWYEKMKLIIENESLRSSLIKKAETKCSKYFNLDILENQVSSIINFK